MAGRLIYTRPSRALLRLFCGWLDADMNDGAGLGIADRLGDLRSKRLERLVAIVDGM